MSQQEFGNDCKKKIGEIILKLITENYFLLFFFTISGGYEPRCLCFSSLYSQLYWIVLCIFCKSYDCLFVCFVVVFSQLKDDNEMSFIGLFSITYVLIIEVQ